MPYGSNDGYGRQQLRDRPSTTLTDVGRRHMSGSSMSSLLSQGDVVQRGPSPTRHTAPGHAPPDCRSPSLYPSTEEGVHAPVQLPHGASRQDLLSALEQANATIRQLRLELRAATRCGSAHDMGLQCEQLEAEQRELVRAFDDLSRVNGNLRRQLKQQARPACHALLTLGVPGRALTTRPLANAGGRDGAVTRGAATGGARLAAAGRRSRTDRPGLPALRGHGGHAAHAHAEPAAGQAARAPEQAGQPGQAQAAAQRGQSTAHRKQPRADLV